MKHISSLYILIIVVVFFGCGRLEPRAALKLYDDQNKLLFSSSEIQQIVIHKRTMTALIVIPGQDSQKLIAVTSKNTKANVYINNYLIEKTDIFTPMDSQLALHLNPGEDKKLMNIIYAIGINSTVEEE